jgi:hypothetical protein
MTRLLICTATILALTASANAQSSSMGNAYFGPGGGGIPSSSRSGVDWCKYYNNGTPGGTYLRNALGCKVSHSLTKKKGR